MKDMKYTSAENKKMRGPIARGSDSEGPGYPYGLCIRLESPELKKLGLDNLPPVGAVFNLEAVGKVTSVHQELNEQDSDSRSLSIQITGLEIKKGTDNG